ncbi:hypothetical protein GCM10027614_75430 [Micromonospora vulcania]
MDAGRLTIRAGSVGFSRYACGLSPYAARNARLKWALSGNPPGGDGLRRPGTQRRVGQVTAAAGQP